MNPIYQCILYGGRLIALNKKSVGIRPIVVGCVWRRLTAKCACSYATSKLAEFFTPVQVGIGVPGGCEAPVHVTRGLVENMGADDLLVKLDYANAFNCLHRDHMLNIVMEVVPEIHCFCYSAYRYNCTLQFGSFSLSSQVGPQQGDPLAGLLFCFGDLEAPQVDQINILFRLYGRHHARGKCE